MSKRPVILIICDYFLPGFESGGAVRTLANLIERLGGEYEFVVITRDHDGTAVRTPYPTVKRGDWNQVGAARVFYLRPDQVRAGQLATLVREVGPDAVYLNSFFSRLTIIFLALLRLRRVPPKPVILAPEGEFSEGALALGPLKKSAYISASKPLLLSKDLLWKAASDEERTDIERVVGNSAKILVAANMPPKTIFPEYDPDRKARKSAGKARFVFLSRFMRKKNFNWLFRVLPAVQGQLEIDIYGTLEEPDYLAEFERMAESLPANVRLGLRGVVAHEEVGRTLFAYDFFILPTLGENFGHVMIEALAAGCPLIISDRTPWKSLAEKGIGWDIALDAPSLWLEAINTALNMGNEEYQEMSRTSRRWSKMWLDDPEISRSNAKVLDRALGRG